jgi:hypothetical protein
MDGLKYSSPFTAERLGQVNSADKDPLRNSGDLGLQLHYHLLRGTVLPDGDKTYAASRHHLAKDGTKVEVLDFYWGDLSGLDGAVTRIIAELYTLIFHVCQLGRDTVHHMTHAINTAVTPPVPGTQVPHQAKAPDPTAATEFWADVLSNAHQYADLLFTKPSGVLNALLVLLTVWWLGLAWLFPVMAERPDSAWQTLATVILAIAASLLIAVDFYLRGRAALASSSALAIATGLACGWILLAGQKHHFGLHFVAIAWGVLLAAVFIAFMDFCKSRVRGVGHWGLGLGLLLLGFMALGAWRATAETQASPGPNAPPLVWVYATLNGIEVITMALVLVWAVLAGFVVCLVVAGAVLKWMGRANPTITRSVDTGRFGLYVSIAMFTTITIAAWGLAIASVKDSIPAYEYLPMNHHMGLRDQAQAFVDLRFQQSSAMFAPALLVLLGVLMAAIAMLFPSVLAEIFTPAAETDGDNKGKTLGHWLTVMGRVFSWTLSKVIFGCAILFVFWGYFSLHTIDATRDDCQGALCGVFAILGQNSDNMLGFLTYLVAGSAAGLLVIGGKVFGSVRNIRLALDAALDVDRHFREFPDRATPRGRVAARLLSVLNAVSAQGYDRVVICAHSQGTIIITEMLRDLQFRDPAFMAAMAPMHLFTCGSPLRQLYAARFPALYTWVERQMTEQTNGPHAANLGVERWTNAYCTGDYVGRWLWQQPGQDLLATGQNFDDGIHRQHCLGKGAHTHYYDARMVQVAREIERLVLH